MVGFVYLAIEAVAVVGVKIQFLGQYRTDLEQRLFFITCLGVCSVSLC